MSKFKNQAPISILLSLGRLSILLILPLLRGFLGALTGDFTSWAKGAWLDILVVLAIISFAISRWACFKYLATDDEIIIKRGVLIKESFSIPLSKITTISYKSGFFLRLFGCAKLYIDTPAGSSKGADVKIVVKKSIAETLLMKQGVFLGEKSYSKVFQTKSRYALIFSALMSNSFAGTVIFATFIYQVGDVLGRDFSDMLYGKFEEMGERLSFGFPPAAAAIAYILLAGYGLSFLINFFNYQKFTVCGAKSSVCISSGVFNHQEHILNKKKVVFIDITQTVITRIMGVVNVFIKCVGFGKNKHTVSTLIPLILKEHYYAVTKRILPDYKETALTVKPKITSVFRFIFFPLSIAVLIFFSRATYLHSLRSWGQTLDYISLMAYIPCFWYMAVRLLDFFSCGIGESDGFLTLCFSKKLTLHKMIIKRSDIVCVNFSRSLSQYVFGTCDVIIKPFSESDKNILTSRATTIKIKSLSYSEAKKIFSL